jgi:hypothetical protein
MHRGGRIRRFLVRLDGGGRRDGIFIFILQTFLETVDTLEQGFEDVCFGAAFFGDGIVDAWALKDLACFTARTHTIAFDLSLSTWFAVHGLARFGSDSAGSKPVDTDGGARNNRRHDDLMIDRIGTEKRIGQDIGKTETAEKEGKKEAEEEGEEEEKKEEKDEDQLN